MTPEGKVKAKVKKLLDERGVYYFMPATGGYGRSGIPDFICCYNGRFMAIECKAGKGDLTALQTRELTRIDAAGGEAVVVRETSMDNFIKFLGFFK
jgi:Holliday junction resolvase